MEAYKTILGRIGVLIDRGYQLRTPEYFSRAMVLVKNNLGLFATYTIIYFAFLFLVFRLGEVGSFIQLMLAGPISAGYYLSIHYMATGRNYGFESFFDGFKIYFPVMLAALATNFLISLGLMLFIVPGLVIALFLIFVMPMVVFGKLELFQAIKYSPMIVYKGFWEMSKLGLFILLINIAGIFTFGIGLLFTLPMSFAVIYFAYSDLLGIHEAEEDEPKPDFSHFR